MESIPEDLLIKISNLLSTRERARLAAVSKEWQRIVSDNWTTVRLEPAADHDEEEAFEGGEHLAWFGRLARRSPHTLQSVYIQPLPAPRSLHMSRLYSLLPVFDLHCCTRLQRLELKPTYSSGNMYAASITPEALQHLSSLIHLEVLSLSLEGRLASPHLATTPIELSLQGIALLPRLQHLDLNLGSSAFPWTLALLHEPGFQSLKSLSIENLHSWNSEWMPEVISRLEALRLAICISITEVTNTSNAPNLTSLKYRSHQRGLPSLVPFKTSANLRMLSAENALIQQNMPSVNCNMASLELNIPPQPDIIRSWSTLRSLTELSVGCASPGRECIMQPYTCLSRLKSLSILGCTPAYQGKRVLEPHDGIIMEQLTRLIINLDSHAATYNAGEMTRMLPALKQLSLHAAYSVITGEICSSTLEVLSMTCSGIMSQWPQALLGELPCLHKLDLRLDKGFHEAKVMLAHGLSALKNLRELSLLWVGRSFETPPGHDDTIDVFLGALGTVTGLTALKIFFPTSDINLSLVNFPCLMTLSVGCKAVKFGSSGTGTYLQRKDVILDLQFTEASDQVLDHLRACQHSVVRRSAGDGLMFFDVQRRANCGLKVESPFKLKDRYLARRLICFVRKKAGIYPLYPMFNVDEELRLQL